MTTSKFDRFLPISGVISGVLFAVGNMYTDAPGITASAVKQIQWYHNHKTWLIVMGVASGYFLVAMTFFATGLRAAIRAGEGDRSTYSGVAYAGGLLVALAVFANGLANLISVEAADHKAAGVITTVAYFNDLGWMPWAAGSAVLFLGAGIGGRATKALPKWLSIVTIVLGVLSMTGPTGILVFFVTPLWLIITGVVLSRRQSSQASVPVAAPTTAYVTA